MLALLHICVFSCCFTFCHNGIISCHWQNLSSFFKILHFLSASSIALLALTLFFFHFSLLKNLFFYTSYLIIRDLTWSFMILLDHSWSFLIIFDHSWSWTTMYLNNLNSLSCQKSPIFPKISHFSKISLSSNISLFENSFVFYQDNYNWSQQYSIQKYYWNVLLVTWFCLSIISISRSRL